MTQNVQETVEDTDAEIEDLSRELVPKTDPILREELPNFDFRNPPINPSELAHILAQTVIKLDGLGLSSNQIGLPFRAFVVKANPIICCFNPSIVDISEESSYMDEGCLTFPNLFMPIKRPEVIRLRYTEPNGQTTTKNFEGITSRVMQHELDHLDGILFMDRATEYHLTKAKNRKKILDRREKRNKTRTPRKEYT
jgi:peptide deformylase